MGIIKAEGLKIPNELRACLTILKYIAPLKLPMGRFGKHLPTAIHKSTVRKSAALKLIHEPCGRIAEVSIHTVYTRE